MTGGVDPSTRAQVCHVSCSDCKQAIWLAGWCFCCQCSRCAPAAQARLAFARLPTCSAHMHPLGADGGPGRCDPTANADQKGPCCNPDSGWCGNVRGVEWGHCDCIGCIDYSAPQKENRPQRAAVHVTPKPAPPKPSKFRPDGRCGPRYPAPGALDFGECDPKADADQRGPCCNPESGFCGNVRWQDWGHCDCPTVSRAGRFQRDSRHPCHPCLPPVCFLSHSLFSCPRRSILAH